MKTTQKQHRNHTTPFWSLVGSLALAAATLGTSPAHAEHFGSAFRVGSTGNDGTNAICRDAAGNLYVTGYFSGTVDFDPSAAIVSLATTGSYDVFTAKYTPDHQLVWVRQQGGSSGLDSGQSVAVDASGNVYVVGSFSGTADFDPGTSAFNLTSAGQADNFVSKLDASGNFVWARRIGGAGQDSVRGVVVDASGNVVIVGEFPGTVDFDPGIGSFNLTSAGGTDVFVCKLDANGGFLWARRMGGAASEEGQAVAVDTAGNVLTTGFFQGTADFNPGAGVFNLANSSSDVFVSKLNSSGNFVWAKRLGGPGFDQAFGLAVDATGNVLVTGAFSGTADFDPGAGIFNLTSSATSRAFVTKLDSLGALVWARRLGGEGKAVTVDAAGHVFTTGSFTGTADFDPGAPVFNLASAGESDIFVSRLDGNGAFVWAGRMGGAGFDLPYGIATDSASANVWTTGIFSAAADFDPGAGSVNLTADGPPDIFDAFVCRLTTHAKVLWSNGAEQASLWTVDGFGDKVSITDFVGKPGFTATSFDRLGEGSKGWLLWANAAKGQAILMTLDTADATTAQVLLSNAPGWTASSFRTSADGSGRIVWTHPDGSTQFWTVDANGHFAAGSEMAPASGWAVKAYCR